MSLTGIWRERLVAWVEQPRLQMYIIVLIVINGITLGLETSTTVMARVGGLLHLVDRLILAVFVVEIGLKLAGYGWRFFRQPWNVFDFAVVTIALFPSSGPFAVLRVLRILRVLRLISMLPRLRFVVESLIHAVPGIGAIAGLLVVLFYVFSVMAVGFFGSAHPEWFGSVGAAMYTLFQVMTLESWSMGIVRPVMEGHAWAWAFFIPFILLATFTMLNLFIAVIVNTMQTMHEQEVQAEHQVVEEAVQQEGRHLEAEIRSLREEIRTIRALLESRRQA